MMPNFTDPSHRKGFLKSALTALVVLSVAAICSIYSMTEIIQNLDIAKEVETNRSSVGTNVTTNNQTTSKQTTDITFASSNQNITSIPENDDGGGINGSVRTSSVNVDANVDAPPGDTSNQTNLDHNGGDKVVHSKNFDKLEQQQIGVQQQQQQQKDPDATLLVALIGEFGNNMFIIINAWAVAKIAKEEFGFIFRIVFEEQTRDGNVKARAKRTSAYIKKCMMSPTFFQHADFELGNRLKDEGYFHEIKDVDSRLKGFRFQPPGIRNEMKILINYLNNNTHLYSPTSRAAVFEDDASIVPVPMVRIANMNLWAYKDPFYDDMRKDFIFDESKCCGKSLENPPASDETVLHLRNFYTEISTRDLLHYRELDADRIASELLGQLKEGDKIALAGRNIKEDAQKNDTEAFGIVSAIKAKNLTLRFSPGTDPMEDFCFLTFTEKELIGTSMSTYFILAALWARPANKLTRIYQPVHEARNNRMVSWFGSRNFTNVELQSRIRFETYYSKDYPVTNNTMVSWKSYGGAKYWPEKPWQRR